MVKILVVDDKYFVRLKLRTLLEASHHQVVEAENGIEAIKVFKEEKPDLIFCDVIMPEMDGLTTLVKILEMDPNAKINMVTSLGEQSILMEALARGAKEVILKPFDEQKILDLVKAQTGQ